MNDYILCSFAYLIGFLFQVFGAIGKLKGKYPEFPAGKVIKTYLSNEWNTIGVSVLIYFTVILAVHIKELNNYRFTDWIELAGMYGFVLVIAYGGHQLAYKWLGTADKVLKDKADTINKFK